MANLTEKEVYERSILSFISQLSSIESVVQLPIKVIVEIKGNFSSEFIAGLNDILKSRENFHGLVDENECEVNLVLEYGYGFPYVVKIVSNSDEKNYQSKIGNLNRYVMDILYLMHISRMLYKDFQMEMIMMQKLQQGLEKEFTDFDEI
ncbi:hypothetical protein [Pseudothermotoga thermarum]|uniref:Uncharacterized protein n=1 Tax=Pseudothermotoga thermarum DSM 5069 TaxID=688269 RepID=F7YWS5_9THEM|nr:hypothetical protein [Pseudothermotoga thermarum]AEH50268.1 hypothetical protein Theth_0166 [Pseudothermotoga thermarum DSM 5069]